MAVTEITESLKQYLQFVSKQYRAAIVNAVCDAQEMFPGAEYTIDHAMEKCYLHQGHAVMWVIELTSAEHALEVKSRLPYDEELWL